jgi:predicted nucleic acid-binding Zn ribbon protein
MEPPVWLGAGREESALRTASLRTDAGLCQCEEVGLRVTQLLQAPAVVFE